MKIRCPKCNALYRISSKKIPRQGARATCKSCGSRFEIPGGMVTAPVAQEASETRKIPTEDDRPAAPQAPRPVPPPPAPPAPRAQEHQPDPLELAERLMFHQNNLSNLRQQASELGQNLPRFVSGGIDFELDQIREVERTLRRIQPPLQLRLRRLPEPGEPDGEERIFHHLPVLLGRSTACDWRLDSSQISQFHARLVQFGRGIKMEDLGSTNGGAIIRDGSLVHRFQPKVGGDRLTPELLDVRERDLLYVATTRIVVEEIAPEVSSGGRRPAGDPGR